MRVLAASLSVCALAALILPVSVGASGSACPMACCLQRQAASPDSCEMHHPMAAQRPVRQRDPDDPLCGPATAVGKSSTDAGESTGTETLTVRVEANGDEAVPSRDSAVSSNGSGFSVGILRMSAPCQSECGTAVSVYSRSRKQREAAAKVSSSIPLAPLATLTSVLPVRPVGDLPSLHRISVPRGPPFAPSV